MDKFLKVIIEEENTGIKRFIDRVNEQRFKYYASDVAKKMAIESEALLHRAVINAMKICSLNGVDTEEHFCPIYKDTNEGLYEDFKLTPFGFALVSLNSEAFNNVKLANFQFSLIEKALGNFEEV